jgi:hypothetical protein
MDIQKQTTARSFVIYCMINFYQRANARQFLAIVITTSRLYSFYHIEFPRATKGLEPITRSYRDALLSTLLHDIVYVLQNLLNLILQIANKMGLQQIYHRFVISIYLRSFYFCNYISWFRCLICNMSPYEIFKKLLSFKGSLQHIRHADHVAPFYPQKLALASPTSCKRSVGIVRSRTKATEFF